jgi:hypothetical protein
VLGGNDLNIYPGFNGQFTRPVVRVGVTSFLGTAAELLKYALECNPAPAPDCVKSGTQKIIPHKVIVEVDERKPKEILSDEKYPFPE